MGRIDDVLNIAGHRLGTMEIESALVAHPKVAEAAVVSKPHDIKGESAFAYVVLNVPRPQGAAAKSLIDELRGWVSEQLSPIAKPDEIRLTDNLPKTRSGKIMRRLLRAIARGEEITQDMSTLENPAILEQLRGGTAAPEPAAARKPAKARKTPRKAARRKAAIKTAVRARKVTSSAKKADPARSKRLKRKASPNKAVRSKNTARKARKKK
jgi:hypothetical protein